MEFDQSEEQSLNSDIVVEGGAVIILLVGV
jgi:hypothetical protein